MLDPTKPVVIDLLVDGKRFGIRTWHHVPRVGEMILIEGNTRTARVDSVIWSEAGADSIIYDCWVQLVCSEVGHVVGQKPKKKSPARKRKAGQHGDE